MLLRAFYITKLRVAYVCNEVFFFNDIYIKNIKNHRVTCPYKCFFVEVTLCQISPISLVFPGFNFMRPGLICISSFFALFS
jgi:hypothetical protein